MSKQKGYSTIQLIIAIILAAFVTFVVTIYCVNSYVEENYEVSILDSGESSIDVSTSTSSIQKYLKKIRSVIDKYYLWNDEIDDQELQDGAVEGYVAALGDDYTEYIPADEMEEYTESIMGNFVGIGIYMYADEEEGKIIVLYPIPESPAAEAGIEAGDIIISVDGVEYTSDDLETIADSIKGEEGTDVTLVVERDGEQHEYTITRATVNTNPITIEMLDNNIGYLQITSFDEGTADDFKEKMQELEKQGAKKVIIDIRNNGGGIVSEATEIADMLLEKGKTIMSTEDNTGERDVTFSENDAEFTMPIVVLINENSASASEILACSLKDNDRATLVGKTTYGKGIIQTVLTLSDGSGLKITTEEYYTPKGTKIHQVGIDPDEEVELPDSVTSIYSIEEDEDTQLQKAIELLS